MLLENPRDGKTRIMINKNKEIISKKLINFYAISLKKFYLYVNLFSKKCMTRFCNKKLN
jgi:hypothetical protein